MSSVAFYCRRLSVGDSAFAPQGSPADVIARIGVGRSEGLARDGTRVKLLYATRDRGSVNLVVNPTMVRNACHRVPMGSVAGLAKRARPTLEALADFDAEA